MAKPLTKGEEKADGRIKPGEVRNPKGRPKGSRHKLGESFLSALQEDFDEHGAQVIETVRRERPQDYMKVVASILPKELTIKTDPLEELSDDELDRRIRQLAGALSLELGTGEGAGTTEKTKRAKPAKGVSSVH